MTEESETDQLVTVEMPPEALESLPDDVRVIATREFHQGPLPSPQQLVEYEQAMPGLSDRLVRWTEEETAHRRKLENDSLDEMKTLRAWGQKAGFALSVGGLIAAAVIGAMTAASGNFAGAAAATAIIVVCVGGPFAARLIAGRWNSGENED